MRGVGAMTGARAKALVAIAITLHLALVVAEFLAPCSPTEQRRELSYAPPTVIRLVDASGRLHGWPFIYRQVRDDRAGGRYVEDTSTAYPVRLFVEGPPYRLAGVTVTRRFFGTDPPAGLFLLGTDMFGRDQFSRLVHGLRVSVGVGLLAATVALLLGALAGGVAGYAGGVTDGVIARLNDVLLAVPWLYLLLAVRSALPLELPPAHAFLIIAVTLALVAWVRPARLVRGVVCAARGRDFVLAARAMGASHLHVLRRHVAPQATSVLATQATLLVPQFLLAEVTLSFLGLGMSEPRASVGSLLTPLQQYHVVHTFWWMLAPALALVPLCLLYFALADLVQERLTTPR